jgi:lambda family phage minor tail protein L
MSLQAELQELVPSALLELYVLDLTETGHQTVLRFYSGLDRNYGALQFRGYDYSPWPIKATGFAKSAKGPFPRPELTLSNVTGYISSLLPIYDDFVGAKVTRQRTVARYLDNGANPDPNAVLEDVFFVNQRKVETQEAVTFELVSSLDLGDKVLPGRIMVTTCPSEYRGPECSWPGTNPLKWYDRDDVQVFTQSADRCGRKISSCKKRFGANAELTYGGFPGMGRTR